jgi:hypothetical protein
MLRYPNGNLIHVTERRYVLASFESSIIPSIELFIFDTVKQYHDPSYADYESPFGIAVVVMPISFVGMYLGSRLLGSFDRLSYRNVTMSFYVAMSLLLLAITAGHIHSIRQLAGLISFWLALVVPAVTAGYVWWMVAGCRNSIGR